MSLWAMRGSDESDQEWGLMAQWSWSHLEKTSRGGWSIYSTPEKNGGGDCLNKYAHANTNMEGQEREVVEKKHLLFIKIC